MPTPGYMSIKGVKQGDITKACGSQASMGNTWQKGHEDEIIVQGFSHEVTTPVDSQTGMPSGHRLHKPFIVSKVFDKSSPLLYGALCSGELLKEVVLKWYRVAAGGAGGQEHYFTHKLEDAIIVRIQASMPHCQDTKNKDFTHLEDIHFSYRKISWTHVASKTDSMDDWRERGA